MKVTHTRHNWRIQNHNQTFNQSFANEYKAQHASVITLNTLAGWTIERNQLGKNYYVDLKKRLGSSYAKHFSRRLREFTRIVNYIKAFVWFAKEYSSIKCRKSTFDLQLGLDLMEDFKENRKKLNENHNNIIFIILYYFWIHQYFFSYLKRWMNLN